MFREQVPVLASIDSREVAGWICLSESPAGRVCCSPLAPDQHQYYLSSIPYKGATISFLCSLPLVPGSVASL